MHIWKAKLFALLEVPGYHPLSSLLQQTRTDFSWDGINVSAATPSPSQSTLTLLFFSLFIGTLCRQTVLLTPRSQGCTRIILPWFSLSIAALGIHLPGSQKLHSVYKAPQAFLFLCPLSYLPCPSSPWRTPLPSSRSLSETLMPMALGPWPSHHSQVRLQTWKWDC